MSHKLQTIWAASIALILVAGPLTYRSWHIATYRNFHVVHAGVLYRSGLLTRSGLERVVYDQGIRTVVNLREGEKDDDRDEEGFCKERCINFFRMAPLAWHADDGSVPAVKNIEKFRAIMTDPRNYPVLVHCYAGIHRTGQMCAIYRMDFEGWTNTQAIAEMRRLGYTADHQDVLSFLTNYRPRPVEPITGVPVRLVSLREKSAP